MKVALIDNGINYDFPTLLQKRYEKIPFIRERQPLKKPVLRRNHATICAWMMEKCYKQIEIVDLQALDCYGRATSSEVYNALKWCYRNNIQVINMSLGTIYIKDIQRLYPIIRKLIQKGCVIVAAYSNEGLQSYPACAKDVIGVRQDWLNLLKPYEYCLKENQNIIVRVEEELTIYGKQLKTVHSNSFATAFMTAFIAEKMDKKHLKNRGEVWRELEKDAKNDVNYFYNLLGCEYL